MQALVLLWIIPHNLLLQFSKTNQKLHTKKAKTKSNRRATKMKHETYLGQLYANKTKQNKTKAAAVTITKKKYNRIGKIQPHKDGIKQNSSKLTIWRILFLWCLPAFHLFIYLFCLSALFFFIKIADFIVAFFSVRLCFDLVVLCMHLYRCVRVSLSLLFLL